MAFGNIEFSHDSQFGDLSPMEKLAATMTKKGIIKVDAQSIPRGILTSVGINKNMLSRVTPSEQIEIEMALSALVTALDNVYTNNDSVIEWILTLNDNCEEEEERKE